MKMLAGSRELGRWVAVIAWAFVLLAGSAQAETVDGFVTQVDSAAGFEVGSLRVAVGPQAGCSVRTVFSRNMFSASKKHVGPVHLTTGPASRPKLLTETPVACGEVDLRVGSEVQLQGSKQGAGNFLADKVVRIEVTYAVPGGSTLKGLVLLESAADVHRTGKGWSGTVSIDGYPMRVTPETTLLVMPATTSFAGRVQVDGTILRKYPAMVGDAQTNADAAAGLLRANSWVSYRATRAEDGSVTATQVRVWPNESHAATVRICCKVYRHFNLDVGYERWLRQFATEVHDPDYSKQVAGTIKFRGGHVIRILADKGAQDYVSRVGMEMVPQYQKDLPESDATKIHFRFYVVSPFKAFVGSGFQNINGLLPAMGEYGMFYSDPLVFRTIKDITAVPDGLILIPDSLLVLVNNEAQLAALLSYAITSVVQKQAYRIGMFNLTGAALGGMNSMYEYQFILRLNQQVLRLGLRPMLKAGYDVREAPFAWMLSRGKGVMNPAKIGYNRSARMLVPPWYAEYSMGLLSEYYADVDYAKLRRGEGAYAEFLGELRKGDGAVGKAGK